MTKLVVRLGNEVETVRGFCCLGDMVDTDGGSEAVVTARMRIGGVKFREYGAILCGGGFSLRVYRSCVRPSMFYCSEAWCLKEYEIGIHIEKK